MKIRRATIFIIAVQFVALPAVLREIIAGRESPVPLHLVEPADG